jgi:hypothetical protein
MLLFSGGHHQLIKEEFSEKMQGIFSLLLETFSEKSNTRGNRKKKKRRRRRNNLENQCKSNFLLKKTIFSIKNEGNNEKIGNIETLMLMEISETQKFGKKIDQENQICPKEVEIFSQIINDTDEKT